VPVKEEVVESVFVPAPNPPAEAVKAIPVENQPPILSNAAPAAPSVRRLAREIGVDVNQIKGTGPGGRILLDDVKAFSKALHQQKNEIQHIRAEQHLEPLPDFSKFGETVVENMSNIRRKTAEHLSHAWHTIPHVTQFDKADITQLEEFRKGYAKSAEKFGVKLTVTAILVKVIASALKTYPQFNASVDMQNKTIVYKKYFNIGIAVDTDFGLIVPVIKNADKLNIIEISKEINALAEKARTKKASVADLQGGCFTITNLGGIGGTSFTPIVNSPEVAILGVSKGSIEPVWIDGKFEPRLMLPLSLSYDHRIIDGADGIRFLRWVIEALENPLKLIVEG
jgi:pyruvate dehydrogenase E2 component (dihydrolipoamide acetyltransferase)